MIYRSPKNPNSHLTAKRRKQPSYPTRYLLEQGRILGKVLDFGSGLGADARYLKQFGFDVVEYDPYYAPEYPHCRFDTILCHYVLNVLLPEEQPYVLMCVAELLHPHGRAYYTVRRDIPQDGFRLHRGHGVYVYQRTVHLPFNSVLRNGFCEIYEYQHYNQRKTGSECPFCSPPTSTLLLTETENAYAIAIKPQNGFQEVFVVPKQHASQFQSVTKDECRLVVQRLRHILSPIVDTSNMMARTCISKHQHVYIRVTF